jgi:hypothetical protein
MTESREGFRADRGGVTPWRSTRRSQPPGYVRSGALIVALVAVALTSSVGLSAQTITTSWVEGEVRALDLGEPLGHVRVVVRDARTGVERSAETDLSGRYRIQLLPPGLYHVTAERLGYLPRRVEGVHLTAGQGSTVSFSLQRTAPPVLEVMVDTAHGRAAGSLPGGSLGTLGLAEVPVAHADLVGTAGIMSQAGPGLAVDGLPSRFARFVAEGRAHAPLVHPHLPGERVRTAYSPTALAGLDLLSNPVDVEWSGTAGPWFRTHARRGTAEPSYRAWATGAIDRLDPGLAGGSYDLWRAGVELAGPLVRDTAVFVVGAEWRRALATFPPIPGLAGLLEDAGVAVGDRRDGAAAVAGLDAETDIVSGWGRLDWRLSEDHEAALDAGITAQPAGSETAWATGEGWSRPGPSGTSAMVTGSLRSALGDRYANEIRVGGAYESSEYSLGDGLLAFLGSGAPATRLVDPGVAFGADPAFPAELDRLSLGLDQRLLIALDRHQVKAGVGVEWESWDGTYAWGRTGLFMFGTAEAAAAGQGGYMQTVSAQPSWSSSQLRASAMLQDTWRAAAGLELVMGVRVDAERVLSHTVSTEAEWERLTGMDNAALELNEVRVSPRLGLRWNVQERDRWILEGGVGVYHDHFDPALLGELATHDGGVSVRRGAGDLGGPWPQQPGEDAAPVQGPALTLLGPDFEAPRSTRASFGLARRGVTSVSIAFSFRHTDFLPRRRDLNLLASPAGSDQHGRPIYGQLQQEGGLVVAAPGTNRQFPSFDVVSSVEATGASEYRGVTVVAERQALEWLGLSASYTYSETRDNWISHPGRAPVDQLAPRGLDTLVGGDWADGISDFDVPHRAAAAVRIAPHVSWGPSLTAVYRHQSGMPFTPGFRAGVDVSGDYASNDPAFIDPGLPGMPELLEAWPCLAEQQAGFATRNACRGDAIQTLDLSAGILVSGAGRLSVRLRGEALNVLARELAVPDRALLLIDPAGSLEVDGQVVTIPYMVNPGFGDPIRSIPTARVFRIGMELNF